MEKKYKGNQNDKSNVHYVNLTANVAASSDPNQMSFTKASRDYYNQQGQNNNVVFQSRLDASSKKAEAPMQVRISPDERVIKADGEGGKSRDFRISSAAKTEESSGVPYNSFQSQWEFAGNGKEPLPGPVLSVSPGEVVLKFDSADSTETSDDKRSYKQPPQVAPGEKIGFQSQWELSGNRHEPLPAPVRSVSETEPVLKTDPNKTVIKRPEFYQPHGTYEFQSQISKSRQSVHNLQPLKPIPNNDEKVLKAPNGKEEEAQKAVKDAEKTKPAYKSEELHYTSSKSEGRYSYSGRYGYSGRYENLNYTKASVSDRYSSVNYTTERHYSQDKENGEDAVENRAEVQENTAENYRPEYRKADSVQEDGLGLEYSNSESVSLYSQESNGEELLK